MPFLLPQEQQISRTALLLGNGYIHMFIHVNHHPLRDTLSLLLSGLKLFGATHRLYVKDGCSHSDLTQ